MSETDGEGIQGKVMGTGAAAWVQVFLVGDPVQLPATVISGRADKHGYSTSLFKRLQTTGFPVQVTAAICCKALPIAALLQTVASCILDMMALAQ